MQNRRVRALFSREFEECNSLAVKLKYSSEVGDNSSVHNLQHLPHFAHPSTSSACEKAKTTGPPAPAQESKIRTPQVGQVVHSDIWGPFLAEDLHHNKYMVTLIDDYSRLTMARAIRRKSDVAGSLRELITHLEMLSGKRVQSIKCDHGGNTSPKNLRHGCGKKAST